MPMYSQTERPGRSVQDAVYRALRKSIITLNLAPGTVISEKEISLLYKVSRTPVREAFLHLSHEGLVQVIPQRETMVSLIDLDRVRQEFFIRENLESAVIRPCALKRGDSQIAEMEKLVEMQGEAYQNNEYIRFINFDDQFHRLFFEITGQELAWNILDSLCGHYFRVRLLTIRLNGIAENIINEHKLILQGIKCKDPGAAFSALDRHLHQLPTEEQMLQERFPAYFRAPGDGGPPFEVDFGGLPPL